MIKRMFWIGTIVLALLAPGGCGIPPTPADLLGPPVSLENHEAGERFLTKLPNGARLLTTPRYGDVDGDGLNDAVIVYEESVRNKKTLKAALFKQQDGKWEVVWDTEGFGYGIDYAGFQDVTGDGQPEILLGWSLGAGGNGLDIYEWTKQHWILKNREKYDGQLAFSR